MKYVSVFMGTLMCLSLVSCTNNGGGSPQFADAPPFDYVDGAELRSRMHQLAFELQRLDSSLVVDYDSHPPVQEDVIDNLRNIERIATELQEGDLSSKHPSLMKDMGMFIADVSRAEWDASRGQYYRASRVTGACSGCHRAAY
ncbi:MAG: hypothetical protein P8I94_07290 [Emcibacteraceae bacterium]|nr:hypothetical protein [Emcibacteraceae bacterium]